MSYFLLHEQNESRLSYLTENSKEGKRLKIEGYFIQCEALNRNRRVYPKSLMERSLAEYKQEYLNQNRSIGELNHPDYPYPDPAKAAIFIESLEWEGNNVLGKAVILDNEDGNRIKSLLEVGYNLGVSTRGLGKVQENANNTSTVTAYQLNAIDAVDKPSGQVCYVNQLRESWEQQGGIWVKKPVEIITNAKLANPNLNESMFLELLEDWFKNLTK